MAGITSEERRATSTPEVDERRRRNREAQAKWRAAHLDTHRERSEAWRVANLEKKNAIVRRYKQRKREAAGRATPRQLRARAEVHDHRCYLCGRDCRAAYEMDHVKPLTAGGSNWPANRRPICKVCNARKGARWEGVTTITALRAEVTQ